MKGSKRNLRHCGSGWRRLEGRFEMKRWMMTQLAYDANVPASHTTADCWEHESIAHLDVTCGQHDRSIGCGGDAICC